MLVPAMPLMNLRPAGRFSPARLFHPESVAVIGAGSPEGRQVMANLHTGGFKGAIVSLDADDGSDVAALPTAPDLAVLATPPDAVPAALAALAAKGTFAAVVISAAEGLADPMCRSGVRVLGPRSFGIVVPAIGLNASRAHLQPPPGRLGLVSQSAALCRAILDWAGPNGVGFSHIVGIGGNADIGFGLVLDWLARDPGTGAILLDIRRIKNRRAFLSGARAASRLRPVVAIRPGTLLSDPGGETERAFEAALRRAGVLCVARLEDLLSAAETLARARLGRGDALAIVTNAISAGRMAADAALRDGLRLAPVQGALPGSGDPTSDPDADGGIATWHPTHPTCSPVSPHPPPPRPRSARFWWCTRRPVPRIRQRLPPWRCVAAPCRCRCWSVRWARRPVRCIGAVWSRPACRCSPRRSRRCAVSCIWCRIAATAPQRANCRRAPCWPWRPTATTSVASLQRCVVRVGWPRCRTRRLRSWEPTAFRWHRPVLSRRRRMRRRRRRCSDSPPS